MSSVIKVPGVARCSDVLLMGPVQKGSVGTAPGDTRKDVSFLNFGLKLFTAPGFNAILLMLSFSLLNLKNLHRTQQNWSQHHCGS